MRCGLVGECAHHMHQRVALTQVTEELAAHPLLGDALVDTAHVEVLHVGGHSALRLEELRQRVEAFVGDLDGREVRFVVAAEGAGFG